MIQKTVLTKKEVIVVLACVLFFTLNLLAAGGTSRRHAKYIVCQANLKQWGKIFYLFAQDNQDNLPPNYAGDGISVEDGFWLGATRPYYQDYKTHLCPSTKSQNVPPGYNNIGSTFEQWGPFPLSQQSTWWDEFYKGSYGLNDWCANPQGSSFWGLPAANTWRTVNAEGGNNIPLLLDCMFVDGATRDTDLPPSDAEHYNDTYNATWNKNAMKFFCMDRHNGGINGLFLDSSVRKINPKELWTLKWHKNFDTDNFWTRPSAPWPNWMQQY